MCITEGTTLTRTTVSGLTEEKVKEEFGNIVNQFKYCFLLTSSGCQTANYNRVQQQIKIPSDTYQTARSCL